MTSNYLLSFADSEITRVQAQADRLWLRFAAAHVTPLPDDAHAPASLPSGYLSGLELLVWRSAGSQPAPLPDDLLGRIAAGQIELDGQALRRLVVPARLDGAITLQLEFANRASLVVAGSRAEFRLDAGARFNEALSC
jgi:hypothetical protein